MSHSTIQPPITPDQYTEGDPFHTILPITKRITDFMYECEKKPNWEEIQIMNTPDGIWYQEYISNENNSRRIFEGKTPDRWGESIVMMHELSVTSDSLQNQDEETILTIRKPISLMEHTVGNTIIRRTTTCSWDENNDHTYLRLEDCNFFEVDILETSKLGAKFDLKSLHTGVIREENTIYQYKIPAKNYYPHGGWSIYWSLFPPSD
ncbi:hypothetical protein TREMEDRAFT_64778 [Tremella mesenterica DSM 1558]|uniref:uncharacterized protein n=1 Tax=Tremella mesenterica (strain ATCC 24925 / CBS 8224 / DSM 1558 / NBRC 9311 / NRRL Y-6157 / RJB 2259-6 / UBC 559-6) TaxID=578456 RepID=UPI0003F48D05|nr:uncharacterized protein TREMEDRAFT_64778 [Tremella mesenterica DSM 1558]EIW66923.1 hypothetical protein TREMEDRAFT_64778 [Tremella mesenterica DSM 1558]